MVAVVALVEVQESVVEALAIMVCGLAPSVTVGGGTTVRVALALAVPPGPVAVIMKVVVCTGDMIKEPLADTVPVPGWMVTVSAKVEIHVSVAEAPWRIVSGLTDRLTVGVGIVTLTVALPVAVPPLPVAVRVYVVVSLGDTATAPLAATSPMPWSIVILSALVVVH
jgi:hypothetical protein